MNLGCVILSILNPSQVRQLHGHSPMALSPTPRALKSTSEPSGELRAAHHGQTVVGIDLGMSSCSMSYRINNVGPVKSVNFDSIRSTVPIALLLRKHDRRNCSVESIGEIAKQTKTCLSFYSLSKHHYFELNMLLYKYKVSTAMGVLSD